jgi:putative SOS response-associated peptidase YedK
VFLAETSNKLIRIRGFRIGYVDHAHNRLINARAETVAEKPAFRHAFKTKRCLMVADGFYEWAKQEGGKQPFYVRLGDARPFGLAGLWEHWEREGRVIESCTVITTQANDLMKPLHDRMPVILRHEDYALWLDPSAKDADMLRGLLRPYAGDDLVAYPVSRLVNNPRNDRPECVAVA